MISRATAALTLTLTTLAWLAPAAQATFHEISIRELYPGSVAQPDSEYVELQMWAPGQNLVGGHSLRVYNAIGVLTNTTTFTNDVPADVNQSTVLLATPAAESAFGVTPNAAMAPSQLDPQGGAACWESIDCVSWGSFTGSLPSSPGPAATPSGIPDGMALRRAITPGCPTLLEPTDDHDSSAADFAPVFPAPRPNSIVPSEHGCSSPGEQSEGAGGPGKHGAPQTRLKRKPPHRTDDRTPTFGFSSSAPGSTFQCKLDRKSFKICRSPFTAKRLALGHHTFKVRARDESGTLDPSATACSFAVIEKLRQLPAARQLRFETRVSQ